MVSRVVEVHRLVCVGASVYVRFCGPLCRFLAIARRWRTIVCFCCGCCVVTGIVISTKPQTASFVLDGINACALCLMWATQRVT